MSEKQNEVKIDEQEYLSIYRTAKNIKLKGKMVFELNFDGLGGDPSGCISLGQIKGAELLRVFANKNISTFSHGRVRENA